MAIHAHDIL